MFNYFNPLYFILAFMIGIMYNLLIKKDKRVIIKYPTIYNSEKLIYKDKADICYKYQLKEDKCPIDKNDLHVMPIQN